MEKWITTWTQAHTDGSLLCGEHKDHTVRASITTYISGDAIRIRVSNQTGKKPVQICQVSVQTEDSAIIPVTFQSKNAVTLQPKQSLYSDPVSLSVNAGHELVFSMAFQGVATSGNQLPENVRYSTKGNYAMSEQMPFAKVKKRDLIHGLTPVLPVLSGVEVMSEEDKQVIVCFGDSITQQSHWTKPLGAMLYEAGDNTIIINKGIGGNRLLSGTNSGLGAMYGLAGMDRFGIDVLEETGVTGVIFAMGTNDNAMARSLKALENCNAEKLMAGLLDLVSLSKKAGLKTYIATITPRGGSMGYRDYHEAERQKLNQLIRSCDVIDGVIDFDAATRSAENPEFMAERCDSGDHLHPGPIGGKRMAQEAYSVLGGK